MHAATTHRPATRWRPAVRVTPRRLAIGLVLLALAVRLAGIGSRPLWLDEAYSAWFSALDWRTLWTKVPTYEPHPPFYYSLLKLWRDVAGGSALALRILSVLLSCATIPVMIAASRELERARLTGRPLLRTGMATFLFACSPMLVMVGQEARPYPLLVLGYAIAILGLLRLLGAFKAGGSGDWSSWLLLALGTELGLWAHGLGALYALGLAAALAPAWLQRPPRDRLVRGAAAASVIALLYLPCLAMMAQRAGDWGTGWLRWEPVMALQLFGLFTVPGEVLGAVSIVAALVLVLLVKRAVQLALRGEGWTADRAVLLLWWGPPLMAILISQLGMPIFLPRTLTATLVPAYLALGGALASGESRRERLALTGVLVLTLVPTALQAAYRPATEPWDEVAAYLARHVRPGDAVWLYPNDSALPLREAGSRLALRGVPGDYPALGVEGPIRAGSPAVVSLTSAQARSLAARSARTDKVIWLVTRQGAIFDPEDALPTELAKVRQRGPVAAWREIKVTPYTRR